MKHERELTARLQALTTLHEAVSAMKSLAAHHFRSARAVLEPARTYRSGVENLVRSTGAWLSAGGGPAGLLVVGAELGLCGAYNARVAEDAVRFREQLGDGPTYCVGHRLARRLGRLGMGVERQYAAPSSVPGITDVLLAVAADMLEAWQQQQLCAFKVAASAFAGVGSQRTVLTSMLPLAWPRDPRAPVVAYTDIRQMADVAIRELIYITLYELLLDALACEHGARLVATRAAQSWLEERTGLLRRHLQSARREASTQEVLEIAAGARARQA
ncbi:MAG: F0F1 ATP synthase subunit gamma [Alcanivorax sp.]|nr:F0F1 ATP synthase subunit gamma [Alcanivorax sp.]